MNKHISFRQIKFFAHCLVVLDTMPPPTPHDKVMVTRCGICTGKGQRKISPNGILPMIQAHHYKHYDLKLHPSVLCLSCELALREVAKIAKDGKSKDEATRKLPDTNYSELEPPRASRSKSSANVCQCGWCKVNRSNGSPIENKNNTRGFLKKEIGRPKDPSTSSSNPTENSVKNCLKCRGVLKKGYPHLCTKTARNENVVNIVRELSPAGQRRVVGKLINGFCEEESVKRGGELNLQSGQSGKVLTITIGAQKKMRQLKIDEFFRFQSNENLSTRKTGAVASFLRKTVGVNIIEPGLEKALSRRKEQLRPFFGVQTVEVTKKLKKGGVEKLQRPMVSCNHVEAFVNYVMDERGMDADNVELIWGCDDGRESLKVFI